jgi:hypothetical protein
MSDGKRSRAVRNKQLAELSPKLDFWKIVVHMLGKEHIFSHKRQLGTNQGQL